MKRAGKIAAPVPDIPQDLLFEIGCEELPATNLADLFENAAFGENPLEKKLSDVLAARRLSFAAVRVWATPRRLVFRVSHLTPAQASKDEMIRLIVKQEAYDTSGKPTEKLLSILKHRGASPDECVTGESQGKEYVFIKKAEPVKKTAEVLPEALTEFVKTIGFPKNMKWDDTDVRFPRPIRNYLCFYGAKPVKFAIGRTAVADRTVIFSKARRRAYPVKGIDAYFKLLAAKGVILDQKERKETIGRALEAMARSLGFRLYDDPFLLSEVNFLVENPHPVDAPFDDEFLNLPLEVLTVSMARKQRIFGLIDKKGGVASRFLAVLDGPANAKQKKLISSNVENILRAKLQDSLFFWREDLKIQLEKKRAELKNLVFLKGVGSMLEKSDRLARLATVVSDDLSLSQEDRHALGRASYLAKADLLTQMVGEFPELQGVMGKYYARENGEPTAVAEAIGEQYLPRTVSDRLPATTAGALLSALDKIDLLAAAFAMGLEPTSSADPYGLRRSAAGVAKILIDRKLNLSLSKLLREADREVFSAYSAGWPKAEADAEKRHRRLLAFFKDRFKAVLVDRGFRDDLVDAAVASRFESPHETFQRVEALAGLVEDEAFVKAVKVVERTWNILKGNKETLPETIDPARFAEPLEREVFKHYEASRDSIREAIRRRDFRRATSLYAGAFFDILGEFFEKVFVNAEDLDVRRNRLALLKAVKDLYAGEVADLSKIRVAR